MDLQRDWEVLQQIAACAPPLEKGAKESQSEAGYGLEFGARSC
jgi:hypothetical protein